MCNLKDTKTMNVKLPMFLLDWMTENKMCNLKEKKNMNVELPISLLNLMTENPSMRLIKYLNQIYWEALSGNPSEGAIQLLEKNQDKIYWYCLSGNPSAMRLLEKNQDKIHWNNFSSNPSEGAMQLLEKNQDKIDWDYWYNLFLNIYIFKYDYKHMKVNCMLFKEDLMKNRLHPRNISKFRHWKVNGFEFDSD